MGFSIVTAVHNGLAMNQFYWDALSRNTETPFELIVVDNHSTDGSDRFFGSLAGYVHHFGRYSAHQGYELIPRREPPISIDAYWGAATVRRLWWGYQLPR